MDKLHSEAYSTKHIGHLGLVADKIDELDLVRLIDQRIPVSEAHGAHVSHGERVAAMILNGLGFIDSRLYLFPDFLQDKAVDRLFNRDVKADYFNDDALGRCLDEISGYGSTKLFTEISFLIGKKRGLLGNSVNIDTTTLSLYGAYDQSDWESDNTENQSPPQPAQGHAKSGRHDLKQMVLLLATTGAASFPVWMEAHSGNASDQKTMPEAAVKIRNKDHGRVEHRLCYVTDHLDWLKQRAEWCDLKTVALVESHVTVNGKVTTERRYFISSLPANAEEIARAIRSHWAIENSLHWVLDVTMGEDLSRVRKDHAPENMAMIRHIVLNLLRGAKSQFRKDMSLKGLQKKAGWGETTLSTILMQEF